MLQVAAAPTESYVRLLAVCEALQAELLTGHPTPSRPGWIALAELPARLDPLVEAEGERIRARYTCTPRPHVAASRLLHHLLWSLGVLVAGPWYLDGQVPRLSAERLWIEPRTADLALLAGQCAPGGPEQVRAALAELVEPLLTAFQPYLRRGPHALWGMAGDDLVSAIWYLGRMLGEEERGAELAAAVLPGGTPPFPGAADFRRLAGTDGRSHLTRTRLGCCMYYAIRPAEACLTCPRVTDAERLGRLR